MVILLLTLKPEKPAGSWNVRDKSAHRNDLLKGKKNIVLVLQGGCGGSYMDKDVQ